jgi:hypothetical protein
MLFIIAAMIAGLMCTTFWLLYWTYRAEDAGAVLFWLLAGLAIGPSYLLARSLVFGDLYRKHDLWLGLQFATLVILVFNAIFLLFRTRILRLALRTDKRLGDV